MKTPPEACCILPVPTPELNSGTLSASVPAKPAGRQWASWLWYVLGVVGFVVGLVSFLTKHQELPLYIRAAQRLRQGEPIHRNDERAFAYPALAALPFVPFTYLPASTWKVLWYLINAGALAVIVYRLRARLLPGMAVTPKLRAAPVWLFWLLLLLLGGRHIFAPLENQSHDLLVLLCVMLAIDASCGAREKAAGTFAGLGTAFKATPLLFAPVFLWQRRFPAFVSLGLALVFFTFLPDVLYPARDHAPWIASWYQKFLRHIEPGETAQAEGAWASWVTINQSLAGTCYRMFTHDYPDVCILELSIPLRKVATLTIQMLVVIWLCWLSRPRLTKGLHQGELSFLRLGQGAAVITAMALLSPVSIKTNFCGLLVPIAFCLTDFLYRRRDWIVGALLLLVFVLGTLTVRDILDEKPADIALACGSITWSAVGILLATGRIILQRSAAGQAELLQTNRQDNPLRAAA